MTNVISLERTLSKFTFIFGTVVRPPSWKCSSICYNYSRTITQFTIFFYTTVIPPKIWYEFQLEASQTIPYWILTDHHFKNLFWSNLATCFYIGVNTRKCWHIFTRETSMRYFMINWIVHSWISRNLAEVLFLFPLRTTEFHWSCNYRLIFIVITSILKYLNILHLWKASSKIFSYRWNDHSKRRK